MAWWRASPRTIVALAVTAAAANLAFAAAASADSPAGTDQNGAQTVRNGTASDGGWMNRMSVTLFHDDRNKAVIGFLLSPLVATCGFFVKAFFEARSTTRKHELDRVSNQVQEFYGPISVCSHRSRSAFQSVLTVFAKHENIDVDDVDLKEKFLARLRSAEGPKANSKKEGAIKEEEPEDEPYAVRLWIEFVRDVAYPLNRRIVDIITNSAHLCDGPFPPEFDVLFQMVAEREVLIQQWARGDRSQLLFTTFYPAELDELVDEKLNQLLNRRLELTGAKQLLTGAKQLQAKPADILVRRPEREKTEGSAGVQRTASVSTPLHRRLVGDRLPTAESSQPLVGGRLTP